MFQKYRDRYVGSIAGESLGYFYSTPTKMQAATASGQDAAAARRGVHAAARWSRTREKYRKVYGTDLDANPYQDVISCLSVGNIVVRAAVQPIGARGRSATSRRRPRRSILQHAVGLHARRRPGRATASDRHLPQLQLRRLVDDLQHDRQLSPRRKNILDNYYSVFTGAGMTWYKFDIWYQYMAGSSMFYHEQGFDEFWQPGGTTAAGIHEVQLSPKGKLVDRFLRVTAAEPDRGIPYTPVAFLVDYAHGWEPAPLLAQRVQELARAPGPVPLRRPREDARGVFLDRLSPDRPRKREADHRHQRSLRARRLRRHVRRDLRLSRREQVDRRSTPIPS